MSGEKGAIPAKHVEFCRALARIAREHGMQKFSVSYNPDFQDEWNDTITMQWEQGRHGEDSDRMFIQSNVTVHTRLGPPKERYY
jgi:hypothetical protein